MSRTSNIRAGAVAFGVGTTAVLAAALISASPAEAPGADRVIEATDAPWTAPNPSPEGDSGGRSGGPHTDRTGPRTDPSAEDAAGGKTTTPSPTPTPSLEAPRATPTAQTSERPKRAGKVTDPVVIAHYTDCTGNAQPCIDKGLLTKYGRATPILAGHDYDGYAWLAKVPVGKRVVVSSGPVAGTYQVYGHMRVERQGGSMPSFGRAALVLQSCAGSGTEFSLLERV